MTRAKFVLVLCFVAVAAVTSLVRGGGQARNDNPRDGDQSIENSLAVQRAVLQARDYLVRAEAKKAVDILEANLSKINGDRKYLLLLRDAYRTHIKDLNLANQPALAEAYQKRLKVLEDYDAIPQVVAGAQSIVIGPATATGAASQQAVAKPDPFALANEVKTQTNAFAQQQVFARRLVTKADEEFQQKHYGVAKNLYEQANQADALALGEDGRKRWAYCQLSIVVEEVNRFPEQPCDLSKLENDVKNAVAVAPHLSPAGNDILSNIAKRRNTGPGTVRAAMPVIVVKHVQQHASGWRLAETTNFRVFHLQSQDYAAKVAETAEITRSQMSRKWFGREGDDWTPKCDIFLYATGADLSQKTGQPGASPGHSKIDLDSKAKRVTVRQINLRCDNPTLLEAVLPHETTHVVLAGQFGGFHVPRWADEGIAVLTEPSEKVQQHRRNLMNSLEQRQLIRLQQLLQMENYPAASEIGAFYAQSVALVEFLTQQKGPVVLTQFIRDGLHEGYESAVRKHYGFQSIAELQDRFTERMVAGTNGALPAGVGR